MVGAMLPTGVHSHSCAVCGRVRQKGTGSMAQTTFSPASPPSVMPATTATDTIMAVEGLEKQYPGRPVKAVDGISFTVRRGEIFGLLGPNGAGKTTTIGILTTRVLPTGGRALVDGIDVVKDPVAVKPHIAVVPQMN